MKRSWLELVAGPFHASWRAGLGWAIAFAVFIISTVAFWPPFRDSPAMSTGIEEMLKLFPSSMLEAFGAGSKIRIGLGTHDVRLIEQAAEHAAALGLPRATFEVQMLYGIRMDQQRRLARDGFIVRDLIAYGAAWYPWYMRRLAERPANVLFALRQIVRYPPPESLRGSHELLSISAPAPPRAPI